MGKILLAWELGGGIGHMVPFLPIAEELIRRGHRVYAALKDLSRAEVVLGGSGVIYVQSPIHTDVNKDIFKLPLTFPHILHNLGFSDSHDLVAMVNGWRNLFQLVKPDLIVFDHSPTAMVAGLNFPCQQASIGTGFVCPPDVYPYPNLRPWRCVSPEKLQADEDRVLGQINRLLKIQHQPELERIGQLYSSVDEQFLATFAELDHYPERTDTRYWGVWTKRKGNKPKWPAGEGKKIFAYLKPSRALPQVLEYLRCSGHSVLIYIDRYPGHLREKFESSTLRFESEPIDLTLAAQACDAAILNGTHGTTAFLLLAGKPIFQLPLNLEQTMVTNAVMRLGAGIGAPDSNAQVTVEKLKAFLSNEDYARAARQFAAKYADFDPTQQYTKVAERMDMMVSGQKSQANDKIIGI